MILSKFIAAVHIYYFMVSFCIYFILNSFLLIIFYLVSNDKITSPQTIKHFLTGIWEGVQAVAKSKGS